MATLPRFDSAYLILYGYPVLFWLGFWLCRDVTGLVFLVGALIAVPLFLLQGRGEPVDPNRPKYGFPWFRLLLAGVVFSWPFIVATAADWWKKRGKPQEPER